MWHGLLDNLAVVVSAIALWANLSDRLSRFGSRIERVALGLTMGAAASLAIAMAFMLEPGMRFDLRVAPLAIAGYFGGPLAAVLAAAPALALRAWLDGPGQAAGCISIVAVSLVATLQRSRFLVRGGRDPDVVLLATSCSLTFLASFVALPANKILPALLAMGVPSVALNLVGIGLAGLMVSREHARCELVRTNALHRAVTDALPDCLNVKDLDGRFMAANPATARLMGAASSADLIGRTDADFYPAETAMRFRDDELAIQRSGREATVEQKAVFPDGRVVWLSTLKAPLHDASGRSLGLITSNRDITQQKALSADLQQARRQLAEAVDHMADGLIMYDRDGRVLICNRKCRSLFPVTADLQRPGVLLADILKAGVARGEQTLPDGIGLEAWVAQMTAEIRAGRNRVIPMADGRFLAARDRPATDGGFLTLFSDVTAERRRELELVERAERDPLTGLSNRRAFEARFAELHRAATAGEVDFSVLLIDLDGFKQVNDTLGHAAGDHLLIEIARRLEKACRSTDDVARLGGDEFAVLARSDADGGGIPELAQRILDRMSEPCRLGEADLRPSCSIGFVNFAEHPGRPDALLARADQALYAAKRAGRGRWMSAEPVRMMRRLA